MIKQLLKLSVGDAISAGSLLPGLSEEQTYLDVVEITESKKNPGVRALGMMLNVCGIPVQKYIVTVDQVLEEVEVKSHGKG